MGVSFIPQRGYLQRMRVYLAEMYPLLARLGAAVLMSLSFTMLLARLHSLSWSPLAGCSIIGTWNVFALFLILRLMDELKDERIDRELFNERPLPSGKVFKEDITFSLVTLIAVCLVVNIVAVEVFWAPAIVLGYSLLMFKYFFIPQRNHANLLLNLATHNPIIAVLLVSLVILFAGDNEIALTEIAWLPVLGLVGLYWMMGLAWEISRKIRAPHEENAYVTYSRILGKTGAVLAAGSAQTIALLLTLYFTIAHSLSVIVIIMAGFGYAVMVGAYIRFLHRPTPVTSQLKPYAEWYITSVFTAFLIGGILG